MRKITASVTCPSCGRDNGLGVVFCGQCGQRLPTGGITARQVSDWQASSLKKRRMRRKVFDLFLAAILLVLLLAFWPFSRNIGVSGDDEAGRRLNRQLQGMARARSGGLDEHGVVAQTLPEDGLNAYLRMIDKGEYSINLVEDGFSVRHRATWWRPEYLPENRHPVLMVEASYRIEDGAMELVGAKIGKIPLPRFFSSRIHRFFRESLQGNPVWNRIEPVSVQDGEKTEITLALRQNPE